MNIEFIYWYIAIGMAWGFFKAIVSLTFVFREGKKQDKDERDAWTVLGGCLTIFFFPLVVVLWPLSVILFVAVRIAKFIAGKDDK